MTLKLKGPAEAQKITYLEERDWSPERLILEPWDRGAELLRLGD